MASNSKLTKYLVTVPVEARGHQYWTVKARSPEEAIEKARGGHGSFQDDDIEVESCNFDDAEACVDQ